MKRSKTTKTNPPSNINRKTAKPAAAKAPRTLPAALLCDRRDSAAMLGTNIATIRRLEEEGQLTKRRLRNRPTAKVYNVIAEVEAFAKSTCILDTSKNGGR